MGKKTVFVLTFLVSIALLVGGCSNIFAPTEVKAGSVWEAKKMILPEDNFLTELPAKLPSPEGEVLTTVFFCFHSNGNAYGKIVGQGKWLPNGKTEYIIGGDPYAIDKAAKKITIGRVVLSYTLEGGELTLRNDKQIVGVYKLSSEPEFMAKPAF